MIIVDAIVEWVVQAQSWEIYLAAAAIAVLFLAAVEVLVILAKLFK